MARKFRRSPVALVILALLYESPMHPYRMQRLIKERGKDLVVNVEQRASLYQTINQLLRAGLIAVRQTAKQEGFPERTIYELTPKGRETAVDWLREMISTPAQEFPEFPAALSLLPLLSVDDARQQLELREARLSKQIADMDEQLRTFAHDVPRLFLIEAEYVRLMLEAELKWVRSVIVDLRDGQLTWSEEWQRQVVPPETDE